jgi:hypothetical protein
MPSSSVSEQAQPANGQPKSETLLPAAMASGIVTRAHAAGPRWIAEEVALAADESAVSLEREMEKAYAAVAAEHDVHAASASADVMTGAEMSSAASSISAPEPASAMYAVASAAAGESIASPLPQTMHAPAENETAAGPGSCAAEASITQPATGTVDVPEAMIGTTDAASANAATIAGTSIENEIVGGTEDMAANWKNIRDSIAGVAAKPAPAKEDFHEPAAAQPEPETAAPPIAASEKPSPAATDPKAIASIVESVLAELRPKLVEEIAKKIADSKKEGS